MTTLELQKRDKFLLIVFALFAGILYDYFFFDKQLGIAYPIYILLLLSLFWWSNRDTIAVGKGTETLILQYARQGFWELLAVSILNLSILLGCMNFL